MRDRRSFGGTQPRLSRVPDLESEGSSDYILEASSIPDIFQNPRLMVNDIPLTQPEKPIMTAADKIFLSLPDHMDEGMSSVERGKDYVHYYPNTSIT